MPQRHFSQRNRGGFRMQPALVLVSGACFHVQLLPVSNCRYLACLSQEWLTWRVFAFCTLALRHIVTFTSCNASPKQGPLATHYGMDDALSALRELGTIFQKSLQVKQSKKIQSEFHKSCLEDTKFKGWLASVKSEERLLTPAHSAQCYLGFWKTITWKLQKWTKPPAQRSNDADKLTEIWSHISL